MGICCSSTDKYCIVCKIKDENKERNLISRDKEGKWQRVECFYISNHILDKYLWLDTSKFTHSFTEKNPEFFICKGCILSNFIKGNIITNSFSMFCVVCNSRKYCQEIESVTINHEYDEKDIVNNCINNARETEKYHVAIRPYFSHHWVEHWTCKWHLNPSILKPYLMKFVHAQSVDIIIDYLHINISMGGFKF